jgi:hypothetical protein
MYPVLRFGCAATDVVPKTLDEASYQVWRACTHWYCAELGLVYLLDRSLGVLFAICHSSLHSKLRHQLHRLGQRQNPRGRDPS